MLLMVAKRVKLHASVSRAGKSEGRVVMRRADKSAVETGIVIGIATVMRVAGPVEEVVADETETAGVSVLRARMGSVVPRAVGPADRNAAVRTVVGRSVVGSARSTSAPRITMAEASVIDSAPRAC